MVGTGFVFKPADNGGVPFVRTFEDILSHFKKSASPENIAVLIGNKRLIPALLAWQSVVIYRSTNEECDLENENEAWNWLWTQVSWDNDAYRTVSGLRLEEVGAYFEQLKGLKLVYPDGTIDYYAKQYLNSVVLKALNKKVG